MSFATRRAISAALAATVLLLAAATFAVRASASPVSPGLAGDHLTTVLAGASLHHQFVPAGASQTVTAPLTGPDDLTRAGQDLFVAFQNGAGPQGQPSGTGNTDSTVVEFTPTGREIAQWDIAGHCDGLSADPAHHDLVATVNEDANSSLYTIPDSGQGAVAHYHYSPSPLPHNGGTDSVSVVDGALLISASAPGTAGAAAPQANDPAVYRVTLDPASLVATATPVFFDEANAIDATAGANEGQAQQLALTDPDSNEVVPGYSPRFARDFVLDSQGDAEQVYVSHPTGSPQLAVLNLTEAGQAQSINDTAWVTRTGSLFISDHAHDTVDALSGSFRPGTAYVAVTPCGLNSAPSACPAPPAFPENSLGTLNLSTGVISPVTLPALSGSVPAPQGLLYVPGDRQPGA